MPSARFRRDDCVTRIELPSLRRCALFLQLGGNFTTQAVQFTHGQHHVAGQIIFQLTDFERRASEPPKLFSQAFGG